MTKLRLLAIVLGIAGVSSVAWATTVSKSFAIILTGISGGGGSGSISSVSFVAIGDSCASGTPYTATNPALLADASTTPQPLGTATASGTSFAQPCVTMGDGSTFDGTIWISAQSDTSPSAMAQICNNAASCTSNTTPISAASGPLSLQTARALAGSAGGDDFVQSVTVNAHPGAGETGSDVAAALTIKVTCPNCIFYDTFDGTALDSTKWQTIVRHGEYAQSQVDCTTAGNITVNNGVILSESNGATACGDYNIDGTVRHSTGDAASTYTTSNFQWPYQNFTYGTVRFIMSIQAKDPAWNGKSTWPSLWSLDYKCQVTNPFSGDTPDLTCPSYDNASPPYQEIDWVECDSSNWCQFVLDIPTGNQICAFSVDSSQHTYVSSWTPSAITLSKDGSQVCNFTSHVPNIAQFMINIQQATSGGLGDPTVASLPKSSFLRALEVAPWSGQTGQRPLAVTFSPSGTASPNAPLSVSNSTGSGVTLSTVQVTTSDGLSFAGTLSMASYDQDDSNLASLSGSTLSTGKSLSSSDNGYHIINVKATENSATVAGALVVNVH
jgi:hypothetical protein